MIVGLKTKRRFELCVLPPTAGVNIYDEIAPAYDRTMGDDFSQITFVPFSREILGALRVRPIRRHLDLACGTGTFVCRFCAMTNSTSFGFDLSEIQLKFARAKARSMNVDVDFRAGNVVDQDYPDSLDLITMTFDALNHIRRVRDWQTVFRKAYKALVPGGIFSFDVNTPYRLMHDWNVPEVVLKKDASYIQIGLAPNVRLGIVRRQILMQLYWREGSQIRQGHALIEQIALDHKRILQIAQSAGFATVKRIMRSEVLRKKHVFLQNRDFYIAIR